MQETVWISSFLRRVNLDMLNLLVSFCFGAFLDVAILMLKCVNALGDLPLDVYYRCCCLRVASSLVYSASSFQMVPAGAYSSSSC